MDKLNNKQADKVIGGKRAKDKDDWENICYWYARRIILGLTTIEDVPLVMREKVKKLIEQEN